MSERGRSCTQYRTHVLYVNHFRVAPEIFRPNGDDAVWANAAASAQRADHGLVGAARIASICPTARTLPSSWPMAMICSMSAIEAKREVIVILVLAAVAAVRRTSIDVVGRSSFGRPLSSANPSSISSEWGGSTAMTRHHPWYFSLSGPVM